MKYSQQEIIQYVQGRGRKFIRLASATFSETENISIMPDELQRAFSYGIAIDASASMDLVMRLIQIYFFIQNRIL